jgi:hypothetical protein
VTLTNEGDIDNVSMLLSVQGITSRSEMSMHLYFKEYPNGIPAQRDFTHVSPIIARRLSKAMTRKATMVFTAFATCSALNAKQKQLWIESKPLQRAVAPMM